MDGVIQPKDGTDPDMTTPNPVLGRGPATVRCRSRQLRAARYVAHKLFVHKYAIAAMTGDMDIATAHKHYDEAMRNYDGIIAGAVDGKSEIANASELAKGANAIDELLKAH